MSSGQKTFTIEAPLNNLSFGNVSIALLREFYKRGLSPLVFPIGSGVDISSQVQDNDFNKWLQERIDDSMVKHDRKTKALKLWHINGSLTSHSSSSSSLLTFHELDQLTPTEVNILKQQDNVFVTNTFTQDVFSQYGIESTYIPLGFDSHNFSMLPNRPKIDGKVTFFMGGKWEPSRKRHAKILNLWAKKYGNKDGYVLNAAINNPFMKEEDLKHSVIQALEGKQYHNINFLQWTNNNAEYNVVLQSSDIVFGLSGGEGFDLVTYHATAMGAWPIALNAHAYKDYLNEDNAILVEPASKFPCYDGMFFHKGAPFN